MFIVFFSQILWYRLIIFLKNTKIAAPMFFRELFAESFGDDVRLHFAWTSRRIFLAFLLFSVERTLKILFFYYQIGNFTNIVPLKNASELLSFENEILYFSTAFEGFLEVANNVSTSANLIRNFVLFWYYTPFTSSRSSVIIMSPEIAPAAFLIRIQIVSSYIMRWSIHWLGNSGKNGFKVFFPDDNFVCITPFN